MNLFKKDAGISTELVDEPIRILFGTCPGSRKDAEDMARGWIDKFFEVPSRAWLFLHPSMSADGGVHFEIHEGGEGFPLIESVLREASLGESVFIATRSKRVTQVNLKEDGTLQSLLLTESMSEGIQESQGIFPSKNRMKPYVTTGTEWIKFGIFIMGLGLFTLTASGAVHKGVTLSALGYGEVISQLPASRLADLAGLNHTPKDLIKPFDSLPAYHWNRIRPEYPSFDDEINGTGMNIPQKCLFLGKVEFDGSHWTGESLVFNEETFNLYRDQLQSVGIDVGRTDDNYPVWVEQYILECSP